MGGAGSGGPQGELITLSGHTMINKKMEKTEFFNFLKMDLDDYSDISMTAEEAQSFKNSVIRMSYGTSAAIPLRCYGSTCFNKTCIFHNIGKYPLGRACAVESIMVNYLTQSYMEDLGVDPENRSEMVLINELVTCDIIDFRANLGLSGGSDQEAGTLLKTSITETDKSTTETVDIHPLLEAKTRMSNIRQKVLDSFVGTRREKYKKAAALKVSDDQDASTYMADLVKRFEQANDVLTEKVNNSIVTDGDWSLTDE